MNITGPAVVIGGASGIGRATAQVFATEGCPIVIIGDIDIPGAEETAKLIRASDKSTDVHVVRLDLASEESVVSFFQSVTKITNGRLDHAANVAAIVHPNSTHATAVNDWDLTFNVNMRGFFLCEREELKIMLSQPLKQRKGGQFSRGTIVNVASMAGIRGNVNLSAYTSSKHAIVGLTKSDGLEYGKDGIRVNVILPGLIDTPGSRGGGYVGDDEGTAEILSGVALGRRGQAEEVAQAIVWLSSWRSSYVTATILAPNGGMIM